MMEWQEMLDKFRKDSNGPIYFVVYHALESMLEKLASEEAAKPEEEPVKDGFRLERCPNEKVRYEFEDEAEDKCFIQVTTNLYPRLDIGMVDKMGNAVCLTPEMVRALLPKLQEFVEKGEIA